MSAPRFKKCNFDDFYFKHMNLIKKSLLTLAIIASCAPYMSTAHMPKNKQEKEKTKPYQCLQTLRGNEKTVFSIDYAAHNTGNNACLMEGYLRKHAKKLFIPNVIAELIVKYIHRQTFASSMGTKLQVWDTGLGKYLRMFHGHTDYVNDVCCAPDGATLASGSDDKSVRLWHTKTGTCLRTLLGHTKSVWSVCYAPHGRTLASASADMLIKIWDVSTGQCLHTLQGHTWSVLSICYAPDGKTLASSSDDRTIKIWHAASGTCLQTLKGHTSFVYSVCYSPDGKTLASSSGQEYNFVTDDDGYGEVKVWNISTGACLHTLYGHSSSVLSISYAPNGKRLASASIDKSVKVWNPSTGQCLHTLEGHRNTIWSVCYARDGKTLASASSDETIKIWKA